MRVRSYPWLSPTRVHVVSVRGVEWDVCVPSGGSEALSGRRSHGKYNIVIMCMWRPVGVAQCCFFTQTSVMSKCRRGRSALHENKTEWLCDDSSYVTAGSI